MQFRCSLYLWFYIGRFLIRGNDITYFENSCDNFLSKFIFLTLGLPGRSLVTSLGHLCVRLVRPSLNISKTISKKIRIFWNFASECHFLHEPTNLVCRKFSISQEILCVIEKNLTVSRMSPSPHRYLPTTPKLLAHTK